MTFPATSSASSSRSPSSAAWKNERPRLPGAILLSVILHGGTAVLLVMGTWTLREKTRREKPFILVPSVDRQANAGADAGLGARSDRSDAGEIAETPDFREAMTRRQRAEELRADREIARMREQRRQEEARLRAAAERTEVINRGAGPERAPGTARQDTSRTTSYSEFQRRHATPPDTSRTGIAGQRSGPRVDTGELARVGQGPNVNATPGSANSAEARAMDGYFGDLIARLRESHEMSGLVDLLSAEVEFTLAANGTISAPRILRSSGDTSFDRSILNALSRVRMPSRPDGKSDTRRLTFRVRES